MKTISIMENLEQEKVKATDLEAGMIVKVDGKIVCLIVTLKDSSYPVNLIDINSFWTYDEFEDFENLISSGIDIEILGKLTV